MQPEDIKGELTNQPKEKPNGEREFGKHITDHMFIMDYTQGHGWHDTKIVPYQHLTLDRASIIFHYGQTVFEGLKAYRTNDDDIQLFRPEKNYARMNHSNDRLVIPHIDETFAIEATKKLISIDQDWVPAEEGTSLYVRPFIIATESYLGIAPSTKYRFM